MGGNTWSQNNGPKKPSGNLRNFRTSPLGPGLFCAGVGGAPGLFLEAGGEIVGDGKNIVAVDA